MAGRGFLAPVNQACKCRGHRTSIVFVLAFLFVAVVFLEDETPEGDPSFLYTTRLAGFSLVDIFFLVAFAWFLLYLMNRLFTTGHSFLLPQGLSEPLVLLGAATAISFTRALFASYPHPFVSWKNSLLGVLFLWGCYDAFSVRRHMEAAIRIVGVLVVLRAVMALLLFSMGRGVVDVITGYVPMWDGVNLYFQVAAVLIVLALFVFDQIQSWVVLLFIPSFLCVLLSLRRNAWGTCGIGALLILSHMPKSKRNRYVRKAILGAGLLGAGLVLFSQMLQPLQVLGERAASVNVFSESTDTFYATNLDHLNDVLDAWEQIVDHPVFGYGIGRPYETSRILSWKEESWGVHNGPLNAWLKFGILGFVGYLWFHFRIWTKLRHSLSSLSARDRALLLGMSAFPLGLFVVSCTFVPGPYESFRGSILIFSLLAVWSLLTSAKGVAQEKEGS